ncbi:MAG: efflux RND transporter periplasmic adaptor subunit [Xanthomonadaceae bacterium]|nr:efflux RND transporter periplasmic adaptor subunit [Xanthomonadaceae bacterium]
MKLKSLSIAFFVAALAACGAPDEHAGHDQPTQVPEYEGEREVLYWYDPMHPQQRFDKPGPSPFMDMQLVPRYADEVNEGRLRVAPVVQQTMNIRSAAAERRRMWRPIDAPAVVGYDESKLVRLHPRVDGWIEEVGVNAVGEAVTEGQVLFTLYSPRLVTAQDELLLALRRDDAGAARAARDNLRALGVQDTVIAEVERTRRVQRALPWHADSDGVVRELGIRRGMAVGPGDLLLELADLSTVWLTAEVFDRHATWLRVGQPAEATLSYAREEKLETEVAYIYPTLDDTTRTLRVRLPLANPSGTLRPGMWASVRIFGGAANNVLMVPREALIRTGTSVRVVLRDDAENFVVREITAGAESGDWVEIRQGLAEGDEVVVSGQFLLDSEAALRAGHGRLEGAGHQH